VQTHARTKDVGALHLDLEHFRVLEHAVARGATQPSDLARAMKLTRRTLEPVLVHLGMRGLVVRTNSGIAPTPRGAALVRSRGPIVRVRNARGKTGHLEILRGLKSILAAFDGLKPFGVCCVPSDSEYARSDSNGRHSASKEHPMKTGDGE
jgi:hypothetical protein